MPVIFLDLNADDFSSQDNLDEPEAAGWDATLTGEEEDEFFDLQVVKHHETEVKAEASWDCTVHNCPQLSKGSSADERVFLIVRVTVQLSHPAEMQLVLRKRICVNVYSRQGFAQSFLRRMSSRSNITSCGVTVEIVSNIPEDSQGAEDREALARMAADVDYDNTTYIEKYLRSVLAVENILTLDRLRQEVAVKEHLSGKGKLSRRSLSSPNVHRLSGSRGELGAQHNLAGNRGRWESQQDVSQFSTLPNRSGTSPRPSTAAKSEHNQSQDSGHDTSVSSYLNPVKSFVPQMPKLLKSLLPQRDDKNRQPASSVAAQAVPRIIVQAASIDDTAFKPKPVNHEEGSGVRQPVIARSPVQDKKSDKSPAVPSQPKVCDSPGQDSQEGPPSPVSEASSGYFSHSVSTATLSEALITGSEVPTGQTPSPVATDISLATIPTSQEPEKEYTGKHEAVSDQHLPSDKPERTKELGKPILTQDSNHKKFHDLSSNNAHSNKPYPQTSTVEVIYAPTDVGGHPTVDLSKDIPSQHKLPATSLTHSENQGDPKDSSGPKPLTTESPLQSKVVASPFKIQKVKTSELKSFTRMLGDDVGVAPSLEKVVGTGFTLKGSRERLIDQLGTGEDPSEGASDSEESQEVPEWLKEGEYVTVGTNKNGIVRYVGPADFQEGMWIGVELDLPAGKNDGSVGGKQYFKCNPGYGVLVRPKKVKKASGTARRKSAGLRLQGGTEDRKTGSLSGSAGNLSALTSLAKPDRAANLKAEAKKKTENRKSWAN